MNKIKAVVIDDEFLNRDLITQLVLKINPNYHVLGSAENVETAYALINEHKPDVVFLDIKMPDGTGFDLLRKFENPDFEVVFVTGFDEYAVQAFEFNALDYILKPIDTAKLKMTLDKVQSRINNKISIPGNLMNVLKTFDSVNFTIGKIPIHYKDHVILLDINDIVFIEADNGYTLFNMFNSEIYSSSKNLATFEFIIDVFSSFIRIHKSAYVNVKYVKKYSKNDPCIITLVNGEKMEVSRRKKTEILGVLNQIIKN